MKDTPNHARRMLPKDGDPRSEEHTSELQSRVDLVCRLLLEKKKKKKRNNRTTKNRTKKIIQKVVKKHNSIDQAQQRRDIMTKTKTVEMTTAEACSVLRHIET